LLLHEVLIWVKSGPVQSRCHYMGNYEPLAYGWTKGMCPIRERRPLGGSPLAFQVSQRVGDGAAGIHLTMKPVDLIRRPVLMHTEAGEIIYEPFCGSGTAIIAAEMSSRRCYALEISPAFVDVAIRRWEDFSGQKAGLEDDGRRFGEAAA
jgi:hypothetical protein